MKNLKEFETESNYLIYRDDKSKYLKPNVSLSDEEKTVYYNYPPKPKPNGYDYVDLDLPSGTLWATCNVGASKPSDYGLYFQWGDTQGYTADQVGTGSGQKRFTWNDYKFSINGSFWNFSKYKITGATLESEDDAAHVNMGGDWHMPTAEQIQELCYNTSIRTATQDGIKGRLFISKKDKSKFIFIPASGGVWDGLVLDRGRYGRVWSSTLNARYTYAAELLYFYSGRPYLNVHYRYNGLSVRGVIG